MYFSFPKYWGFKKIRERCTYIQLVLVVCGTMLGGMKMVVVVVLLEVASECVTEKGTDACVAASVLDGDGWCVGAEKLVPTPELTMNVFFLGLFFFSLAPCTPWIRISASRRATTASDQQPWWQRRNHKHVNNRILYRQSRRQPPKSRLKPSTPVGICIRWCSHRQYNCTKGQ